MTDITTTNAPVLQFDVGLLTIYWQVVAAAADEAAAAGDAETSQSLMLIHKHPNILVTCSNLRYLLLCGSQVFTIQCHSGY